jgi:transglutaminase-like putative cysteine protease
MRLLIRHEINLCFEPAARFLNGAIRLTPRNHEGQFLANWRLALDTDGRLRPGDDAFGNLTHGMALAGPLAALTLRAEGEVGTFDTAGVIRGTLERFPPEFFLRETPLTAPSEKLRSYTQQVAGLAGDPLARLHELLAAVHKDLAWEKETQALPRAMDAAAVFATGKGQSAGLAHVFIAGAHQLAIPARLACGYCLANEAAAAIPALHCWAEAHLGGLGWIGFDPTAGHCPDDNYVRLACGLDAGGIMPIRVAATGTDEALRIDKVSIVQLSP